MSIPDVCPDCFCDRGAEERADELLTELQGARIDAENARAVGYMEGRHAAERFARAWKALAREMKGRNALSEALLATEPATTAVLAVLDKRKGAAEERARIVADLLLWAENVSRDAGTVDGALEIAAAALGVAALRYRDGGHWKVTP